MTARRTSRLPDETIALESKRVAITHAERVLFPGDGITKGDLVHYYRDVAHWMLPYMIDRPLTLQRWPSGIDAPSFWEKQIPRGAPAWMARTKQPSTGKRPIVDYPICNDAPSLLWLANLGAITFHVWTSRIGTPDSPDDLLFDLDPFDGCTIATLARVALTLREELEERGLSPRVKTTGGKGLHVMVPMRESEQTYATARVFEEKIALRMKDRMPSAIELERTRSKRARGTVYFDWGQLGRGKTVVPPFAVRARPRAPVSMPIAWSEVEAMAERQSTKPTAEHFAAWNLKNVPRLLVENGDPWAS